MKAVKYLMIFLIIFLYNFIYTLTIEVPVETLCLCTMDIELDGDIDIISGHCYNPTGIDTITVLINQGNMEFEQYYLTEEYTHHSMCKGFFNEDEYPDFVTGGKWDNSIRLYLNDGSGGFLEPIMISEEVGATKLITADFENDGDMDIFYFNSYYEYLGLLINDGFANFNIFLHTNCHNENKYIEVKDLNGDLYPDIFLGGRIYINHLDWLEERMIHGNDRFIYSGDLGDFDNDGDCDVYFQRASYPGYLELGINNGEADFDFSYFCDLPSTDYLYVYLKSEDINNNGYYDIIYLENASQAPYGYNLNILLNENSSNFDDHTLHYFPSLYGYLENNGNLHFTDIDSDEDTDILIYSIWPTTGEFVDYVICLFNDGEGYFTEEYVGINNEEMIIENNGFEFSYYPNPFLIKTNIKFYMKDNGFIELNIYDIKGSLVKQLLNQNMNGGEHHVTWNGKDQNNRCCSSGIYLMDLKLKGVSRKTSKLILLK